MWNPQRKSAVNSSSGFSMRTEEPDVHTNGPKFKSWLYNLLVINPPHNYCEDYTTVYLKVLNMGLSL